MSKLEGMVGKLVNQALNLLLPMECIGCRQAGSLLCDNCIPRLPRLEPPYCNVCSQPYYDGLCRWCIANPLPIEGIRAPFLMEGDIRQAIHDLKYNNVRAFSPVLGSLLSQYLKSHPLPGEVIIPVPLHRNRLRSRGYNQSALLAQQVRQQIGLSVEEKLLARTRNTLPQVRATNREERWQNLAGSFQCCGDVNGLKVILLDDVTTTGSTMSACAVALKNAGATSVWGVALAKEA